MGNKLRKKKSFENPQQPTAPIDTISKLNNRIEIIDKREHFLEKKIALYRKIARQQHRAGKTKDALNKLRLSKIYEKEVKKLGNVRMSLQQQIINLESSHMNIQTIEAMKEGQKAMKSMSEKTKIEEVEKLHEDIEEHHQTNQEISDILTQPVGNSELIDEDELEQEYNNLIAEELTKDLLTMKHASPSQFSKIEGLPPVPTHKPSSSTDIDPEEEAELEELERSMAV